LFQHKANLTLFPNVIINPPAYKIQSQIDDLAKVASRLPIMSFTIIEMQNELVGDIVVISHREKFSNKSFATVYND